MYLVDGTMRQGRYLDGLEVQRLRPVCTGTQRFVGACGPTVTLISSYLIGIEEFIGESFVSCMDSLDADMSHRIVPQKSLASPLGFLFWYSLFRAA